MSTLCEQCLAITYDEETGDARGNAVSPAAARWRRTDTYPDLPLFHASALKGCTFCNLLRFLLREKLPLPYARALQKASARDVTVRLASPAYIMRSEIVEYTRDWTPDVYENDRDGIYWLSMIFESPAWPEKWQANALAYQQDAEVSELLGINLRIPAPRVLDPACIDLLRESVERCVTEHPECQPSSPKRLPTRLIDVGDRDDETARLVITETLPSSTPYIALSYCWGPPSETTSQLVTTTATLPRHQQGISLSSMPGTIRDAVIFTRHMGIRHIWVDAICIVQDDADDWANEAALMDSVYRHAAVTVVAAAGDTCYSGFLRRETAGPTAVVPFSSRKKMKNGINHRVSGSYLLSHMRERRTWDADYPSHLHQRSWATRAWTYQEDIMSTRVLYFDSYTSFFRCQRERRLEHSITVYTNVIGWHKSLLPAPKSLSRGEDGARRSGSRRRARLYDRWEYLIEEYSQRKLTIADDKFPAVSGLARSFAAALGEEYVAGLWRGDLIRGLLWWTEFDAVKSETWRAPSWSWAAWDGGLGLAPRHSRPLDSRCVIEEVRVEPAGPDPFGRLRDAWLILSAVCVPVAIRPARTAAADPRNTYQAEVLLLSGGGGGGGEAAGLASFDAVTVSGLENDGNFKAPDVGPFVSMRGVSAVVLALGCINLGGNDVEKEYSSAPLFPTGLLVILSKNHDEDQSLPTYERVGVFMTESEEQARAWAGHSPNRLKLV